MWTRPLPMALLLLLILGIDIQSAEIFRVFKSTDAGRSWTRSDSGLPSSSRVNAFGSAGTSLLAALDSGIFISQDRGEHWRPATADTNSSRRVLALGTLGARVFAGVEGPGLLVSSDSGSTWTLDRRFPDRYVRSLLVHNGKLYAGTDAGGVFISTDEGGRWTALRGGFPTVAQVFSLAAVNGKVFAALYGKGLYRWEEVSGSWSRSGSVSPLVLAAIEGTLVVGHNPGGICTSDDLGATWTKGTATFSSDLTAALPETQSTLPPDAPVWQLAAGSNLVFAGASSGMYYSQDRGRTWTRADGNLPDESPGVAFLVRDDFVLAATFARATP